MNDLERQDHELNPWVTFLLRLAPKGEALADLAAALHQRKRQRVISLFEDAARHAGMKAADMLNRILEAERRVDLLESALGQASTATNDDKRRVLARALAMGVKDDARIDEAELLLSILDGIEVAHIRILQELASPHPGSGQLEGFEHLGGVTAEFLREAVPGMASVTPFLLCHLQAKGLIENKISGTWGSLEGKAMWGLTAAGEKLLDLLKDGERAADSSQLRV